MKIYSRYPYASRVMFNFAATDYIYIYLSILGFQPALRQKRTQGGLQQASSVIGEGEQLSPMLNFLTENKKHIKNHTRPHCVPTERFSR